MTSTHKRIIIDTDIGGDPDDAAAISLALASPELIIEGITTVYFGVDYHARRAAAVLKLGGRTEIPIYNGLDASLLRNRIPSWWNPDNRDDSGNPDILDSEPAPKIAGHAVEFIIRTVMDNPGEITLVGIGPLTNIAAAIIMEPRIVHNVKEIILMGGAVRLGDNAAELYPVEYNMQCDPEAAGVVFSSGAPIVMAGLDVTRKVVVSQAEIDRLIRSDKPLNLALADVIRRWMQRIGEETTPMHDPLAMALTIDRSLVTTRRMKVKVDAGHPEFYGQTIAISDPFGNVDVCIDVDAERFNRLLFGRLCGGGEI
jgi:purine nucleosidase